MKKAKDYRSLALEKLSGNWKPYVLATLVLALPVWVLYLPSMVLKQLEMTIPAVWCNIVLLLVMLFLYLPMTYGYLNGCVAICRNDEKPLKDLMLDMLKNEYGRGFRSFGRILLLSYLMCCALIIPAVIVAVCIILFGIGVPSDGIPEWMTGHIGTFMTIYLSMVFVFLIPVLIWYYAVSLTPYLAHDRKELSIRECMKESKRLMKGHKWQLFCLHMSFIGWSLLSMLTCGIGALWLQPYTSMATAIFYEDVLAENAPI